MTNQPEDLEPQPWRLDLCGRRSGPQKEPLGAVFFLLAVCVYFSCFLFFLFNILHSFTSFSVIWLFCLVCILCSADSMYCNGMLLEDFVDRSGRLSQNVC